MPKCKICGSRIPEGSAQCPICGTKVAQAGAQPHSSQKPVQPVLPASPQPSRTTRSSNTASQTSTSTQTSANNPGVKCNACGSSVPNGAAFCPMCGAKTTGASPSTSPNSAVNTSPTPPQQSNSFVPPAQPQGTTSVTNSDDDALMRAYITGSTNPNANEPNYDHYKKAFDKFAAGGKVSWNWGAFWTGGWNLAYRKSYLWGILEIIAESVSSYEGLIEKSYALAVILFISDFVLRGMFLDCLHYWRFKKELSTARQTYPNDIKGQVAYMAQNGGVNKAVPIIFGIQLGIRLLIAGVVIGCTASCVSCMLYRI